MKFVEVCDDTLKYHATEQDPEDIQGLVTHAKTAIQNLSTHTGLGPEEVDEILVNYEGGIITISKQDIIKICELTNTMAAGFGQKTMKVSEARLIEIDNQLRAISNKAWPVDMSDLEEFWRNDETQRG